MKPAFVVRLCALLLLIGAPPLAGSAEDKWEAEVAAVEARLERSAPAPGGVVFAGSSSIRLWPLDQAFPGLKAAKSASR